MKPHRICISLFISLLISTFSNAQSNYPKGDFISPVEFPMLLSGTFAELRGNHFHSGIDIRTQGVEGKKILACADGYVSRIRISPFGFGKTVYITHPNDYSTVYAHLSGFNPEIDAWSKAEQYRLEQFDVDLFPQAGLIKVKQGDVIGYSGNSGSSQGPHLHFEIRDSKTERPFNPLLFGLAVKDFTRPTINGLRLYPEGDNSLINGSKTPYNPVIAGWGLSYRLSKSDTIEVSGSVSFGINAHDLLSGSNNKNGINRISVFSGSELFFEWNAESFSFSETRYINSFIDYATYSSSRERFMRTKIEPNNKLGLYRKATSSGILRVREGIIYPVKIEIADGSGNTSAINFVIRGRPGQSESIKPKINGQVFSYKRLNRFVTPHLKISMPGDCLYDSIVFEYSSTASDRTYCAPVHKIHNTETPLHNYYDLSIRVDTAYHKLADKLVMVILNNKDKPSSAGGKYQNGFLNARVREFGRFSVMADTIAPVIKPLNIANNKKISAQQSIRVSISDNLSGIKSYRGTLNGKWILMDYDPKNNLLKYNFDELLNQGVNEFLLEVTDDAGNTGRYSALLMN